MQLGFKPPSCLSSRRIEDLYAPLGQRLLDAATRNMVAIIDDSNPAIQRCRFFRRARFQPRAVSRQGEDRFGRSVLGLECSRSNFGVRANWTSSSSLPTAYAAPLPSEPVFRG